MKRIVLSLVMVSAFVLTSSMAQAKHQYSNHNLSQIEIQAVQQGLREAGYYRDAPVDGRWGPVSIEALTSFQAAKGLDVTGVPDKQTLAKLGVRAPRRAQEISKNSQ